MKRLVVPARGFSLVELAMVLFIVALVTAAVLPTSSAYLTIKARETTQAKLKNIETALLNYVVVNKRLPCAANATALTGVEAREAGGDCTGSQASGVVPWVTLGLSKSDVMDSWNVLVTYRAGYGLTRTDALDMSWCDPAGTATTNPAPAVAPNIPVGVCLTTCVNTTLSTCTSPQLFLERKGLSIRDGSENILMDPTKYNGAAFVLISHGQNTYGAYSPEGVLRTSAASGVAGTTLEDANLNGPAVTITSVTTGAPVFREADYSDASDATTYFDDILVKPSLISVIQRAQLGPRSH